MTAKLIVVAVFFLAAAAAGDALRGVKAEEGVGTGGRVAGLPFLVEGQQHDYAVVGGKLFQNSVLRSGAQHLSTDEVAAAFPGESDNPIDVSKIAVAPDGTLVLGVYRFRPGRPAEGAVELWSGRHLSGSFLVPPGFFGGGFAFSEDGRRIATIAADGTLNAVFDRKGRLVGGLLRSSNSEP